MVETLPRTDESEESNEIVPAKVERLQGQLQLMVELARITNSTRDLNELMAATLRQLRESYGLAFVGIFLIDEFGQWAVLRGGTGDAGASPVEQGYQIKLDANSPLSYALKMNEPVFLDHGKHGTEAFVEPLLPTTAMAVVTPLAAHGQTRGFLTMHCMDARMDEQCLTAEDAPMLKVIGENLAYAIENVELFARAQTSVQELERAQRGYVRETWGSRLPGQELVYTQKEDAFAPANGNGLGKVVPGTEAPGTNGSTKDSETGGTLSVPITLRGEVIGTVDLFDVTQERFWNEEEKALASSVVEQMALAVENARLFEDAQARAQELATINQISQAATMAHDLETLFQGIYEQLKTTMPCDAMIVNLHDAATGETRTPFLIDNDIRYAEAAAKLDLESVLGQAIVTGKPQLIHRTPEEVAELQGRPGISGSNHPSCSLLYVPMILNQQIIGTLSTHSYKYDAYTPSHVSLLSGVANTLAVGLDNARLFQETQQRAQETAIINELARELSGELEQENLFARVQEALPRLMPADAFVIWLFDESTQTTTRPVLFDLGVRYPPDNEPVSPSERLRTVIERNAPVVINLTRAEWDAERGRLDQIFGSSDPSASLLYVALRVGTRVRGVVSAQSYQFNAYGEREVALLTSVANLLATALENATLFAETRNLFEGTQSALAETQTLYRTGEQLNQVASLEELVQVSARPAFEQGAGSSQLLLLSYDANNAPTAADTVVSILANGEVGPTPQFTHFPIEQFALGRTLLANPRELLMIEDVNTSKELDEATRGVFLASLTQAVVLLPLTVEQHVLGLIVIGWDAPHVFSARERRIYQALAGQMALVLNNRLLLEQTQQALAEARTLYQVSERLNKAVDLHQALAAAASVSVEAGAYAATLMALEVDAANRPAWGTIVASWTLDAGQSSVPLGSRYELSQMPISDLWIENPTEPILLENVDTDPRLDERARALYHYSHVRASILMPMRLGNRWIALAITSWTEPHKFSERDQRLYRAIMAQAATVLDNRSLLEQTEQALAEAQTLYEISARLNAALSVQDVLKAVAASAIESESLTVNFMTLETDGQNRPEWGTVVASWSAQPNDEPHPRVRMPLASVPITKWVFDNPSDPFMLADIDTDPRVDETAREYLERSHTRTAVVLPLRLGARWVGLLNLAWSRPQTFSERDPRIYRAVMAQAATVLDNRALFEQTEQALAETQTLYEISARLNSARTIQESLEAAAGPAIVQGAFTASLLQVDADENGEPKELELVALWPRNAEGAIPLGTRVANDYFGDRSWIDNPTEPLVIENINTDARVGEISRAALLGANVQATALLPVKVGFRWLGLLNFNWQTPHAFTAPDLRLFRSIMTQAATVLDNRALFEQTQEALALNENLYRASQRLATAADLNELVSAVVDALAIQQVNRAVLLRFELGAAGQLETAVAGATWYSGNGVQPQPVGTRYPRSVFQGLPIVQSERVQTVDDVATDPRLDDATREVFTRQQIKSAAILPLWVRGVQRGSLFIQTDVPHQFSASEVRVLDSLTSQLAIAIENRRLFEETQQALGQTQLALQQAQEAQERLNLQFQTANILARAASFEHAATPLLENTCRALNWQMGEYWTIDEGLNRLVLTHLWTEDDEALHDFSMDSYGMTFGRGEGLAGRTWEQGSPVWVSDIGKDQGFKQAGRASKAGLVSALAFPLQSETHQFGVTVFFARRAQEPDDNLMSTMLGVGSQIGQYLERRRAEEAVRQQNTYLTALHDTTLGLMRRPDVNELLQNIITRAGELVGTEHGYVHLLEPSGDELRMRVGIGIYQDFVGSRVKPGQGLAGTIWRDQEPIVVDDYRYWSGRLPMVDRDVLRAVVGVPLKSGNATVGVLGLASLEEGRRFGTAQVEALNRFAELAAVALDNAQLYNATQQNINELSLVNQISREIAQASEVADVSERVVTALTQTLQVGTALIALYDRPNEQIYLPAAIYRGEAAKVKPFPFGKGFASHVIRTRQPLLINGDVARAAAEMGAVAFEEQETASAYAAVPILDETGQGMGMLAVEDQQRVGAFDEGTIRLLSTIAANLGVAIERARLNEQTRASLAKTQRLAERERASSEIADKLYAATDVQAVLRTAAEELRKSTGSRRAVVRLNLDNNGDAKPNA